MSFMDHHGSFHTVLDIYTLKFSAANYMSLNTSVAVINFNSGVDHCHVPALPTIKLRMRNA